MIANVLKHSAREDMSTSETGRRSEHLWEHEEMSHLQRDAALSHTLKQGI